MAVRAHEDGVADDLARKNHFAVDQVVPAEFARLDLQPHRRGLAAIYPSRRIFRREISAAAAVLRLAARLQGFFALSFQLFRGTKAEIRACAADELLRKLSVKFLSLRLAIGTVRAADVGHFVPGHPQRTHGL